MRDYPSQTLGALPMKDKFPLRPSWTHARSQVKDERYRLLRVKLTLRSTLQKTSNVPSELVGKLPVKGIVPLDNRIQPRDIVFKYGRTTGWTKGVIHSEPHKIDLELATEWKGEIDHPKEIKESEEFFVNSKMYAGFAEGGDSGSWILNKEGELAGLLWGKFGEYALITDIHTVLESIREVCDWQNKEIEVLTEL